MTNAPHELLGPTWRIQILGPSLVRFEWDPDGRFVDQPTQVVVDRPVTPTRTQVDRRGEGVQVITDGFQLDYDGGTPSASGLIVKARGSYHSVWRYGQPFENRFADLFVKPINLGGTTRTLDAVDGRCELDDGILSDLGIAILDDSTSFQVVGDDLIAPGKDHVDVYVFAHGHDHPAAIADLRSLIGETPLIPRWALGNWWSRFHRYTTQSYLALMDRFAADRLPFSVAVIDMDWHLTDIPAEYGHGWTGYTWNRELFPDPQAFLAALHERGLATSLNVHPADGIRAFEESYSRACELMDRDPADGLPLDFDLTDPAFRRAYFEGVHHPLEEQGVDFWWVDWQQGSTSRTGVDPLWLLNHLHIRDMAERGRRPLILSRYSGPGSQRFPVGFSGDTTISWESLAFQPEFTATAANIGYGTWSHDIGGHLLGQRDDELALRWLQFGVFSPINRLHSSNDDFSGKEPWRFRADIADVMGTFLRLRHALVPYLYTEWATGDPLVRPMYHSFPNEMFAYEVPGQYTFGRQLIVAPIVTPADPQTCLGAVQVWLPKGRFVDVFTGVKYTGGRLITMHRSLGSIPVLAREGAVIPLAADGERPADLPRELEVWVVPGADGHYELVEDDGALEPRRVTTTIRWDDDQARLVVGDPTGATELIPEGRTWRVKLLGTDQPGPREQARAIIDQAQTAIVHKMIAARILDEEPSPLRAVQLLREIPVRGAEPGRVTAMPEALVSALTELLAADA